MRKLFLSLFILLTFTLVLPAQKLKVIGVSQLIENSKYEEAKSVIEDAVKNKSTRDWPRTWYTKGILCQTAYEAGVKKKDKKLYELYKNQLYVAFTSFEKARFLDKRGKFKRILPSKYVLLANDFMTLGETCYEDGEYNKAYMAFDHALRINKNKYVGVELDTNLLYNTALSAYKSKNWDDAFDYLSELNTYKYSSNIPHLMFAIYVMKGDTVSAVNIIKSGIKEYEDNQELILVLVDLLYKQNKIEQSEKVLYDAFRDYPTNSIYPFNIGLFHQKAEEYEEAIGFYKKALTLPCDTVKLYSGIGTCYYNIGAEIDEKARTIENNFEYLEEKEKSSEAFSSALIWFEKAYEKDNTNQEVNTKLRQLYLLLGKREELLKLE